MSGEISHCVCTRFLNTCSVSETAILHAEISLCLKQQDQHEIQSTILKDIINYCYTHSLLEICKTSLIKSIYVGKATS